MHADCISGDKRRLAFQNCWKPNSQKHGLSRCTRTAEAGFFASFAAGRIGRRTSSPPQFGQMEFIRSAHGAQKVHSKVQIIASRESGGRSRSQHSQLGRSSRDMGIFFPLRKEKWWALLGSNQ